MFAIALSIIVFRRSPPLTCPMSSNDNSPISSFRCFSCFGNGYSSLTFKRLWFLVSSRVQSRSRCQLRAGERSYLFDRGPDAHAGMGVKGES